MNAEIVAKKTEPESKFRKCFDSSVGSIQKLLTKWCCVSDTTNYNTERIKKNKEEQTTVRCP